MMLFMWSYNYKMILLKLDVIDRLSTLVDHWKSCTCICVPSGQHFLPFQCEQHRHKITAAASILSLILQQLHRYQAFDGLPRLKSIDKGGSATDSDHMHMTVS